VGSSHLACIPLDHATAAIYFPMSFLSPARDYDKIFLLGA
jgi:hypothetical protein